MSKDISLDEYKQVFKKAASLIGLAQERFLKEANRTGIDLYWELGKLLNDTTQRYQWGKSILARLSADLTDGLYKNAKGYSEQNLRSMRQFYCEYQDHPDLFEVARDVRWRTNLLIMNKVKDINARRFYLQMAKETLCGRDSIDIQIKSQAYEREYLTNKVHNFKMTLPAEHAARAENLLKPSYFLEASEPFTGSGKILERNIENHMIQHIKKVVMMLGKGFAFIGNQYRIEAGGNEYFIDMLFFNRILRSLFCIEIKNKPFKIEHAGKMSLYLNLLDDYVKQPDENPSIGLILCTDKNEFEAKYALRDINKPIGIAEIVLSKVLPSNLADNLPDLKLLKDEILSDIEESEDEK